MNEWKKEAKINEKNELYIREQINGMSEYKAKSKTINETTIVERWIKQKRD